MQSFAKYLQIFIIHLTPVPMSNDLLIQPDCHPAEQLETFYKIHSNLSKDILHNWVCREDFEQKLRICCAMYLAINRRPFTTEYKVVRDENTVLKECQKRNVTFLKYYEPFVHEDGFLLSYEDSEEVNVTDGADDPEDVTIEANLFRCPITKMDLKFVRSWIPIKIFDLYITTGKNDLTVAVLQESTRGENMCVVDFFFYSGSDNIKLKGLYIKP